MRKWLNEWMQIDKLVGTGGMNGSEWMEDSIQKRMDYSRSIEWMH